MYSACFILYVFSFYYLPQLCVIRHVTMGCVLLTTLASVLVDTVDPHAANQVYLAQLYIANGGPWAYIRVHTTESVPADLDYILCKHCITSCTISKFVQ